MKKKNLIALICAVLIFVFGAYSMVRTAALGPTYGPGQIDAEALYADPSSYDNGNPDGVASIIVNTNLEQTRAANVVSAIVFDYRGYDTLGESFILLTAISGAHIILHSHKKKNKEEAGEK